jgi:SAM-dependent methyltransferase
MKISATGYWEDKAKLYHTCCEPLCNWIIDYLKDYKDKTLYDFGCGNGQYLAKLHAAGFTKMTGFEGSVPVYKEFDNIIQQDLTIPFLLPETGNCLFLEVAEHVPAQFENIMLDNIINSCNNKLIMSWARRGQGGYGHVNEKNNDEAILKMCSKGLIYLSEESASAKNIIPNNDPCHWFKNTVLIFQKS